MDGNTMDKIRKFIDKFLLSDHEWKRKYCPTLYNYLFKMSDEERHEAFTEGIKWWEEHRKVCPDCYGIHFEDECPCTKGNHCIAFQVGGP